MVCAIVVIGAGVISALQKNDRNKEKGANEMKNKPNAVQTILNVCIVLFIACFLFFA